MTPDQANAYIGCSWVMGGRGPDAFDCWGLLKEIRDIHFGGGIPEVAFGDAARDLYGTKMRSGDWELVAAPKHGDGVLLRDGDDPHVGIYLDFDGGGVLHAQEGSGVVFTGMRELRFLGYSHAKFYRIHA